MESKKDSFIRWQSITIAQLTYAVNLFLGFAVAALAFQISVLLNEKFNPISWRKGAFSVSLVTLSASVGIGIWCVINRLLDFRTTARVAKMREEGKSYEDIESYRVIYKKLGKRTWVLLWWQISTFGVGVLLLVLGIAGSVSMKLF